MKLMPAGTLDAIALTKRDVDAIEKIEITDDPYNSQYSKDNPKFEKETERFLSSQL